MMSKLEYILFNQVLFNYDNKWNQLINKIYAYNS